MSEALIDAIAGEEAAIFAYGVLGPHLTGANLALAQQAELGHRNLRDQVGETMSAPPDAAVIYQMPFPVTDAVTALAAAVTAYIRVLGGTFGLAQDFRGPLAKQHRMAVMTAGCLLGIGEFLWRGSIVVVEAAAWVIAIGAIITCGTRIRAIAAQLKAR